MIEIYQAIAYNPETRTIWDFAIGPDREKVLERGLRPFNKENAKRRAANERRKNTGKGKRRRLLVDYRTILYQVNDEPAAKVPRRPEAGM